MAAHEQAAPGAAAADANTPHCGGDRESCAICGNGLGTELEFSFAYQPIVDLSSGRIYAHEALVRGPQGQPAASVLERIGESNRYSFDQAARALDLQARAEH